MYIDNTLIEEQSNTLFAFSYTSLSILPKSQEKDTLIGYF